MKEKRKLLFSSNVSAPQNPMLQFFPDKGHCWVSKTGEGNTQFVLQAFGTETVGWNLPIAIKQGLVTGKLKIRFTDGDANISIEAIPMSSTNPQLEYGGEYPGDTSVLNKGNRQYEFFDYSANSEYDIEFPFRFDEALDFGYVVIGVRINEHYSKKGPAVIEFSELNVYQVEG